MKNASHEDRREMMAHFTEQEKQEVEQMLLKKGKELFEEKGLKAVTVDSLTKEIGIGKGTFYHFYKNKGHLFQVISNQIQRQIYKEITEKKKDESIEYPQDFVEEVLNLLLDQFMKYPILVQIRQVDYTIMAEKIPAECLQESLNRDREVFEFIKSKGIQFAYDEKDIVTMVQLIFSQLSVIEPLGYDVRLLRIQLRAIAREIIREGKSFGKKEIKHTI